MVTCEICNQLKSRVNINRNERASNRKNANVEMGNRTADS